MKFTFSILGNMLFLLHFFSVLFKLPEVKERASTCKLQSFFVQELLTICLNWKKPVVFVLGDCDQ